VHVGIFLDLRNPAPWRRPWAGHYRTALELIERAEGWGVESVWLTEHHFFDDGYLSQPLTFAAAVAARTSSVRIGTAVVLGALRHPIHIAEEAAIVDLVSGGRLELGLGAGWAPAEFAAFGADLRRRYSLTDATLVAVRDALLGGAITPPPVQQPIPLWLGYQGAQGARRAGRLGVGLLSLERALLEPYLEGLAEGGHDVQSGRMGGVVDIIIADDPPAALERLLPHYAHQVNTYRAAVTAGTEAPTPRLLTVDALRERRAGGGGIPGLTVLTPTDAVAAIRTRVTGLPVEHVYCWGSIAGMPDDLAERHIELLGSEVRRALAEATS
jgi:alkanesulfonate monooxygenase SsuD/methylene tetrahydromethanopterin reductase-like flavin-dependent oxidoreductase (luciferase family)